MRFPKLFAEKPSRRIAARLYTAAVRQARQPSFYLDLGVADTPDGRFDMVSLHVILLLRRLKRDHVRTAEDAQALFDLMFDDMDQNLREMGVGDIGVGKRIKGMAQGFYGRLQAYDTGLDAADDSLNQALRRNLYRKTEPGDAQVAAMAAYVRRNDASLAILSIDDLYADDAPFVGPAVAVDRIPADD